MSHTADMKLKTVLSTNFTVLSLFHLAKLCMGSIVMLGKSYKINFRKSRIFATLIIHYHP
jgi:hypothetical protein